MPAALPQALWTSFHGVCELVVQFRYHLKEAHGVCRCRFFPNLLPFRKRLFPSWGCLAIPTGLWWEEGGRWFTEAPQPTAPLTLRCPGCPSARARAQ